MDKSQDQMNASGSQNGTKTSSALSQGGASNTAIQGSETQQGAGQAPLSGNIAGQDPSLSDTYKPGNQQTGTGQGAYNQTGSDTAGSRPLDQGQTNQT